MTTSLRLTRAIVERGGAGYVEFRLQAKPVPTEAELRDEQVGASPLTVSLHWPHSATDPRHISSHSCRKMEVSDAQSANPLERRRGGGPQPPSGKRSERPPTPLHLPTSQPSTPFPSLAPGGHRDRGCAHQPVRHRPAVRPVVRWDRSLRRRRAGQGRDRARILDLGLILTLILTLSYARGSQPHALHRPCDVHAGHQVPVLIGC